MGTPHLHERSQLRNEHVRGVGELRLPQQIVTKYELVPEYGTTPLLSRILSNQSLVPIKSHADARLE